jgi:pilus assembly protein Flp/PilA
MRRRNTPGLWLAARSRRPAAERRTTRVERAGGDDMKPFHILRTFVRDEEGQDLIEYALLVALISLVCVVALTDAGKEVNTIFVKIKDKLANAAP